MLRRIRRTIARRHVNWNGYNPKPEYFCLVCLRPQRSCIC